MIGLKIKPNRTIVNINRNQPRASEWKVTHTFYGNGGTWYYSAIVFDYEFGLTEREAWASTRFETEPAFYECVCTMINPWPYPQPPETISA